MSALTDAIAAGDVALVASSIDADASVLSARENGVTPLLFALYHGRGEVVRLLLDRGAPVSFAEACAIGDLPRVEGMLADDAALLDRRSEDGFPPVALAVFFRHPDVARLLIERGADVGAVADNAQRVTPAHAAAAVCDRDSMALLLARGADANARQQGDYRPLHGAASRGDIEMAKLLLAHGAERDAKGADGLTAADVARKYGHPEFAEWIESGGV